MKVAIGVTRTLGERCLRHLATKKVEIIGVDTTMDDPNRHNCRKAVKELGLKEMTQNEIIKAKPDLFLSIKHPGRIKEELLNICPCINLHTAKLPEYRGLNGFAHAIMNNDLVYGMTLHLMDKEYDKGDIIAERFLTINMWDTSFTLSRKVYNLSFEMFVEEIDNILAGKYKPYEQIGERCYYGRKLSKELNLDDHPIQIYNKVRALTFPGYESAYFIKDDKKTHVTFADLPTKLGIKYGIREV